MTLRTLMIVLALSSQLVWQVLQPVAAQPGQQSQSGKVSELGVQGLVLVRIQALGME